MKRNFISNLGFLLFVNLLVKPFWILGIDRTVQNTVGAADYGIYFTLFNFSLLFQVVLDFGFNNFNNRQIAQRPERIREYFSTTMIAKFIFVIAYTIIIFIAAFGIHFNTYQLHVLMLMVIMQILLSFYSFLRSNVAAMQFFKTDAVLSVLDKIITCIICSVLIWGNIPGIKITIENFIWVQIIGYLIAGTVATVIVFKYASGIKWHFDKLLVKDIIKKSFPYALLGFLMTVYYRVDAVMIERMSGPNGSTEAGIYASAFRLLDSLNILGYLMAGILLPLFAKMISSKQDITHLFDLSFKLMLVISASAGIPVLFYREPIMQLLYISGDAYSAQILGLLMISFISISLIYVFGSLLTANGSIRILNLISIAGLVVNVVINCFLIPTEKALGASIATVFTQILVLVAHMIAVNKNFNFSIKEKKWLQALGYLLLVIAVNFLLLEINILWSLKFLLACVVSVLLSFVAGLFKLKELANEVRFLLNRSNRI